MRKGHTLIEVLLVIVILAIIASMAVPNVKILHRIKSKNEISELRKDILFARNKAIIENNFCSIYFNAESNKYIIRTNEGSPSIKTKEFNHGVELEDRGNLKVLQFNPNGVPGSSGTLYISDSFGRTHKITVTPVSGRLGIEYECE